MTGSEGNETLGLFPCLQILDASFNELSDSCLPQLQDMRSLQVGKTTPLRFNLRIFLSEECEKDCLVTRLESEFVLPLLAVL